MKLVELTRNSDGNSFKSVGDYLDFKDDIKKVDEWMKTIKDDCLPYLQSPGIDLKRRMLWRGTFDITSTFSKFAPHEDRKPKNTWLGTHKIIDDWMLKNFGHRYRSNAIFCSGKPAIIKLYGDLIAVFPIGDFSCLYSSQITDLFISLKHELLYGGSNMDREEAVVNFLDDHKSTFQTSIGKGIESGHEIMLACKSAYGLFVNHEDEWEDYCSKSDYMKKEF